MQNIRMHKFVRFVTDLAQHYTIRQTLPGFSEFQPTFFAPPYFPIHFDYNTTAVLGAQVVTLLYQPDPPLAVVFPLGP